jgi:hypothetical protein
MTTTTPNRAATIRWRRNSKGNLIHDIGDRSVTVFRHRTGVYHWVLSTPNPAAGRNDLRHSEPFRSEEQARIDAERELCDGKE